MYKIILADDHAILRAGLKSLLSKEGDFKVVAEAEDGQVLLERLKEGRCDVVIMDLSMPNMDGLQALREVHDLYPDIKILVLTMQHDEEHFRHAMAAGASGYMLKEDAYEQLNLAVRLILKGKHFVSPSMVEAIAEGASRAADVAEISSINILTDREQEVLKDVANGSANKNIASHLNISIRTVEAHRRRIMQKLGLKNTAALVKYSISNKLI